MLIGLITCGGRRSSMITRGNRVDFLSEGILVHVSMSLTYVVGSQEDRCTKRYLRCERVGGISHVYTKAHKGLSAVTRSMN